MLAVHGNGHNDFRVWEALSAGESIARGITGRLSLLRPAFALPSSSATCIPAIVHPHLLTLPSHPGAIPVVQRFEEQDELYSGLPVIRHASQSTRSLCLTHTSHSPPLDPLCHVLSVPMDCCTLFATLH